MADGQVDPAYCTAKKNTQLPPKQHQTLHNIDTMQQNQQNSNPQTAVSGQMQQASAVLQSIQPVQQPIAQQQPNQHTNLSTQTNQQNVMQQQQPHDLQIPSQGSRSFQQQQQPSHFVAPSPAQSAPYAPNPQQPQNQAQSQVLQQIPPPIFQQPAGQQNNYHNLIPGHHQMMQPQQVQQPAITITDVCANGMRSHQPQQQLQQPMAMVQAPILYSSTSSMNSPSKAIQKKGRFRVVKGTANEVKKGRFVVKKGAIPAARAPSPECETKSGKKLSPLTSEAENAMMKMAEQNVDFGRGVTGENSDTLGKTVIGKNIKRDNDFAVPPATSNIFPPTNSCAKKKGRFLVKTGGSAHTPVATVTRSEAANNIIQKTVGKDVERSKAPGLAVNETQNKGDNMSAVLPATSNSADTKTSCTKKKGRFLVKTGNISAAMERKSEAATNIVKMTDEKDIKGSKTSEVAANGADKKSRHMSTVLPVNSNLAGTNNSCTKKKGRFLVKTGNGAHTSATIERKNEAVKNIIKRTDEKDGITFGVGSAAEKSKTPGLAAKGTDYKNDNTSTVLPASSKLADAQNPCTIKKGRFLVRTSSSSHLALTEANLLPSATGIAPTDGPNQHRSRTKNEVECENLKGKINDGSSEQWTGVRKKGRFVVKTGSVTNSPAKATLPDPEAIQNNGIGISNYMNQYSNPPAGMPRTTSLVDANGNMIAGMPTTTSLVDVNGHMITGMPSTTSLVDVNGHVMVLSNVPLALSQAVQQHPLQQISVAQHFQSATASVGSQTQPQPQSNPCDAHTSRSLHAPPLSRPRAVTEERPPSNAHVPRPTRPAGGSGSNYSVGSRACPLGGKHGRLIGTGGVGKVLHYLDTLRSEVVEADRSMASLQSDNRFLRDKNKEFEAKISNLERQLQAEKYLRCTAEANYRSLRNQVRFTDQGMDANQPQTRSGEIKHFKGMAHQEFVSPSSNSLVFLDDSTSKPGEVPGNEVASTFPLANHLDNDTVSEMKLDTRGSISFEDLQPAATANVSLSTNRTSKPPTLDVARTHHVSPSMTSLSTIAIQFDPLGTTPTPSVVPGTAGDSVSNVEIPLIVTTTQPPPPRLPNNMDEAKYTPNISNRTKRFDPLGTSENSTDMGAAVASMGLDGLPPLTAPMLYQQPQRHQFSESNDEDPFNEIIRMRSI